MKILEFQSGFKDFFWNEDDKCIEETVLTEFYLTLMGEKNLNMMDGSIEVEKYFNYTSWNGLYKNKIQN